MERWIVELDEGQLGRLSLEPEQLGTHMTNTDGQHFLVFRDGFVALKVAHRLGAKRRLAHPSEHSNPISRHTPAHFNDSKVQVADLA